MRHPLVFLFFFALTVRVVVAAAITKYFSGSYVFDDQTYWALARDVANGSTAGWDDYARNLYATTRAFSWPLAMVYRLSGGNELAGQVLVALIGAGLSVIVFVLARKMIGWLPAIISALVIALLPSQVLWSSMLMKDAFVWFALALLAIAFVHCAATPDRTQLALWSLGLAGVLFLLAFLRPHTTVVASWALLLSCWAGVRVLRPWRMASAILVAVAIPWVAGLGPAGFDFVRDASPVSEIRRANAIDANSAIVSEVDPVRPAPNPERSRAAAKASIAAATLSSQLSAVEKAIQAVEEKLEASKWQVRGENAQEQRARELRQELAARLAEREELETRLVNVEADLREITEEPVPPSDPTRDVGLRYLARGLSVMVLEPYPWDESTSPSFTMAKFEALIWYPVLLLAVAGLVPAWRRHRHVMLFPLFLGAGTGLLYALTEGNVGTAFRHRGEFVWVVALLAGIGLAGLLERRSRAVPENAGS